MRQLATAVLLIVCGVCAAAEGDDWTQFRGARTDGVVSGAALIAIVRARRPAAHEVRLTVAHDAIPRRRPSTLADDAFIAVGPEPARGGPADRRLIDGTIPLGAADRRTSVRIDPMPNGAARPAIPGAIPIDPGTHTHVFGRIMEPVFPVVGMPVSAVDGGLGLLRPSTAVAVLDDIDAKL